MAKKWDFEISLEEAQNLMGRILEECVGDLELTGVEFLTSDSAFRNPQSELGMVITLAEKLGFNVEKFSKITAPGNSPKQPQ